MTDSVIKLKIFFDNITVSLQSVYSIVILSLDGSQIFPFEFVRIVNAMVNLYKNHSRFQYNTYSFAFVLDVLPLFYPSTA